MTARPILAAGSIVKSNKGPIIIIMNQYAKAYKGNMILSSRQMEWHSCNVEDKSAKVGGEQMIVTLDGYVIPIDIK